jgi:hypothetical protein
VLLILSESNGTRAREQRRRVVGAAHLNRLISTETIGRVAAFSLGINCRTKRRISA